MIAGCIIENIHIGQQLFTTKPERLVAKAKNERYE
jgi:hypothetical protein